MEIKYKRDIRKSYMCVTSQEKMIPFEKNLLSTVSIEGLLPVKIVQEDEKEIYWYDITGAQALDSCMAMEQMSGELFLQLMSSLTGLMERLDNFLLRAENLLLVKESIFYSVSRKTFCFCYYPEQTDIRDNFRSLMEYILTRIDHTDKKLVETAYYVYEQVMKEGFSLVEIRESLCQYRKHDEDPGEFPEMNDRKISEGSGGYREDKDGRNENHFKQEKREISWKEITDKLIHKFFPDIEKLKKYKESRKKKEEIQPIVFEPEQTEIKAGRPTVLLSERRSLAEGIFRYEGNHGLPDMTAVKFPYVIGSAPDCDGYLDCETISRRHAKITKVDDIYFIEDMNSANGTKVGGKELEYRTKMSIQPYETVEFADEKFRFI